MKNKSSIDAFYRELTTLITKVGVAPEKALEIAKSHFGNYDKLVKQIAKERKDEKEQNLKLRKYAQVLQARINGGEKPEDVVKDMEDYEL